MRPNTLLSAIAICVLCGQRAVAQCPEDADPGTLTAVELGRPLVGSLTAANRQGVPGPDTSSIVCAQFRLELEREFNVQILLHSSDFDAFLVLRTADNLQEARDDDSGGDLDARLRIRLQRGTYRVIVTSYSRISVGSFQLTASRSDSAPVNVLGTAQRLQRAVLPALEQLRSLSLSRACAPQRQQTRRFGDIAHPGYYVRVLERFVAGERQLFGVRSGEVEPVLLDDEVDRKSTLVVQFDHEQVDRTSMQGSELAFSVWAEVVSASGGTREVEVPGYSVIGAARRRSGARVQSRRVRDLICGTAAELYSFEQALTPDTFASARHYAEQNKASLSAVIQQFDDSSAAELLADQVRASPSVIRIRACRVKDLLGRALDSSSVSNLVHELRYFGGLLGLLSDRTVLAKVGREQFKDIQVSVPQTGAARGEWIVLHIENDALGDSAPRTTALRFGVVDFGLSSNVRDAFLLVRRAQASDAAVQRASAVLAAGAQTRDSVLPASYNFVPTPGVSLVWHWYPRGNLVGADWLRGAIRWLQPGIGISATYPRFAMVTLQARYDTSTKRTDVTQRQTSEAFQLGAGVVASFFDDAVQVVLGSNLSVEDNRRFWAIGLSFANIAQRLRGPGSQ